MDLKPLGIRIRDRRKALRMTQQELADLAGYKGKDSISHIEAGDINLPMDKVVAIARALRCKPSDLICEDEFEATSTIFEGLSNESIDRIVQYADILKEAEAWQRLNGTEKDGE